MGIIKDQGGDVYRDNVTADVPASGPNEPAKSEIRALFSVIDTAVAGAIAGIVYYSTGTARAADVAQPIGKIGKAANEADYYRREGSGWVVDNSVYNGVKSLIQPELTKAQTDATSALSTASQAVLAQRLVGRETNLIEAGAVIRGAYRDNTTGAIVAVSSLLACTRNLPCEPNVPVTVSAGNDFVNPQGGIGWLDVNGNIIGQVNAPFPDNTVFVPPANARQWFFSFYIANIGALYAGRARNIFDPAKTTPNVRIDNTTGAQTSNNAVSASAYMPCIGGRKVGIFPGNDFNIPTAGIIFKDASGNVLTGVNAPVSPGLYVAPNNATTWAFTLYTADINRQIAVADGVQMSRSANATGRWAGARWAMSGDSIVSQGTWEPTTIERTGIASFTNWGVSGTRMADILTNRTAADFTDIDLYGISTGTNDWGNSPSQTPLGSKTDTASSATFWGAMYKVTSTILGYKRGLRLFFMTPLHRSDEFTTYPNGTALRAYRDAILEFCSINGFPVYDQFSRSGVGPYTFTEYLRDEYNNGTLYLHLNADKGGPLVGKQVAAFLEGL